MTNEAYLRKHKPIVEYINHTQPKCLISGEIKRVHQINKVIHPMNRVTYKVFLINDEDMGSYLSNYSLQYINNLEEFLDQDIFTVMKTPLMILATT